MNKPLSKNLQKTDRNKTAKFGLKWGQTFEDMICNLNLQTQIYKVY